jgi:hypothetical protein
MVGINALNAGFEKFMNLYKGNILVRRTVAIDLNWFGHGSRRWLGVTGHLCDVWAEADDVKTLNPPDLIRIPN